METEPLSRPGRRGGAGPAHPADDARRPAPAALRLRGIERVGRSRSIGRRHLRNSPQTSDARSPAAPSGWRTCRSRPIPRTSRSSQRAGGDRQGRSPRTRSSIVAGETGSGKTTQLPEDLPGARPRRRGHDRPHAAAPDRRPQRRAAHRAGARHAARATPSATRSASTTDARRSTYVKLMTDGILLAETQRDRLLDAVRHDHHRRGPRAQPQHRLPARLPEAAPAAPAGPEADHHLGATIDPQRFSQHFDDAPDHRGLRPHLPRRRPLSPARQRRPGATRTCELRATRSSTRWTSSWRELGRGDVLVFLPGEREIRETAEALRKHHPPRRRDPAAVRAALAPTSRCASSSRTAEPRIVLATNVAETSLTVPGIKYVDRPRLRAHQPLQRRAPASSGCRSSRSRRPAPTSARAAAAASSEGVCFRLYCGAGLRRAARSSPIPEILRDQPRQRHPADEVRCASATSQEFPVPRSAATTARSSDGYQTLHELGAIDERQRAHAARRAARHGCRSTRGSAG